MTYESTRIHKAWKEQVGRERRGAEWFYRSVGTVGRSRRWKELAEIMHKPEYEAEYMFHRTNSGFGTRKLMSRADILSSYFKGVEVHRGKVQEVVDEPSLRRTLPNHRSSNAYFGLSKQSSLPRRAKTSASHLFQPTYSLQSLPNHSHPH